MKHQIEELVWREIVWTRPYKLETVWETLSHLAALPRGAVLWEIRSQNGKVSYLLGAAARYIRNIEEAVKAHGDIQFHEAHLLLILMHKLWLFCAVISQLLLHY